MTGAKIKKILFLDFDGTLCPIVVDPSRASLNEETTAWLKRASVADELRLAVVTGRPLADIRRKIRIKNIIYAANHGAEVSCGGKILLKKCEEFRGPVRLAMRKLQEAVSDIPGVYLEDKGISVAVHLRRVNRCDRQKVKEIVKKTAEPMLARDGLQLTYGKMVIEIRPSNHWNKGDAVLWIWRKLAPDHLPYYVGDDLTDEDAFQALRPYGVTVRIRHKKNSHAEYYASSFKNLIDSGIFESE